MKKVFRILKLENKEVHVDSDDYYRKGNDHSNMNIPVLESWGDDFDDEESAVTELEKYSKREDTKHYVGDYIIIPVYIIS